MDAAQATVASVFLFQLEERACNSVTFMGKPTLTDLGILQLTALECGMTVCDNTIYMT